MNPVIIAAVRAEIGEWRREAAGSRQQAEIHEQRAAEFRRDEARAEEQAAALEAALRNEGVAS